MRVLVERSPEHDRPGWWAYRWHTGLHTGVLWAEAEGDKIDAPQGHHEHITALLLLWRHRLETGEWPEQVEYAPDPPAPDLEPPRRNPGRTRRPIDEAPGLRPRTLRQRAEAARKGKNRQ